LKKKSNNLCLIVHPLKMKLKKMRKINQEKKGEENLVIFFYQYSSNNWTVEI